MRSVAMVSPEHARTSLFMLVIGAGLGLKRCLLMHNREPELGNHLVEHVVGEITQPTSTDLQRHVAVAEW